MSEAVRLPQHVLLDRIRRHAEATPEVVGLLLFGSLARQTADQHSDLDLGLYVSEDAFPSFDLGHWIAAIAPVAAIHSTEHASTVIFGDLVRAEVHLGPPSAADCWPPLAGTIAYPSLDAMVLLDRTGTLVTRVRPLIGRLPRRTSEDGDREFLGLIDGLLVADSCRRRGELARALTYLTTARTHLLRLARLRAAAFDEWVAPERGLERDLDAATIQRYGATVPLLQDAAVADAIETAWRWGSELATDATTGRVPPAMQRELDRRLSAPLHPQQVVDRQVRPGGAAPIEAATGARSRPLDVVVQRAASATSCGSAGEPGLGIEPRIP